MGDRTNVKLYSELLDFLEQRGCSLAEYGSAERGLDLANALAFVELLRLNQVPLHGVEIWRSHGGRLKQDILEIWYSEGVILADHYADVERYFKRIETGSGYVFAIQFG